MREVSFRNRDLKLDSEEYNRKVTRMMIKTANRFQIA